MSWLTSTPLERYNFDLSPNEFRDGLAVHYLRHPVDLPSCWDGLCCCLTFISQHLSYKQHNPGKCSKREKKEDQWKIVVVILLIISVDGQKVTPFYQAYSLREEQLDYLGLVNSGLLRLGEQWTT